MSVQDEKDTGQDNKDAGQDEKDASHDDKDARQDDKDARPEGDQQLTEKPEPDEDQKKKAAEMMTAYEDRPTLVLPGTGGMVSGTAVNDWLDEEGNPKQESPDEAGSNDKESDEKAKKEQIEKDKAWNEELKKASAEENKGEKG